MKIAYLLLAFALSSSAVSLHSAEIKAADIARHLGIRFWKIESSTLPARYSVRLQEIRNGLITQQPIIGAFSLPEGGDLVIGVSLSPDGKIIPTVSVGSSSAGIHESKRISVGMSVKHEISNVKQGVPIVLMADYKSNGEVTVATGRVEDVISGLALIIYEEKH